MKHPNQTLRLVGTALVAAVLLAPVSALAWSSEVPITSPDQVSDPAVVSVIVQGSSAELCLERCLPVERQSRRDHVDQQLG
jgi:hypothetical protein